MPVSGKSNFYPRKSFNDSRSSCSFSVNSFSIYCSVGNSNGTGGSIGYTSSGGSGNDVSSSGGSNSISFGFIIDFGIPSYCKSG